ncbi:hypothetical protein DEO72_LG6g1974 [Vigna unguiculata]|uniref:GIR1-like zinc ribbon domain-containing protein n=1 Tax=Vigna unguiculata TaxID=3917 RepID=A0A4D6MBX1_VIGUN|nr:hypothetical protein DEO72_LG6g1974 [Vigna unguiculata]
MSDENGNAPNLEVNSNLPPPMVINDGFEPPIELAPNSPNSPPISCFCFEFNQDNDDNNNNNNNNFEYSNNVEVVSLVVVGCSKCLMYAMVSKNDLKCPQCQNTNLIHFHDDNNSGRVD